MGKSQTTTEMVVKVPASEAGSYKVRIGSGNLGAVWQEIQKEFSGKQLFIISDANVENAGHLKTLQAENDAVLSLHSLLGVLQVGLDILPYK